MALFSSDNAATCDILSASASVDDIMFSYRETNGPQWSTSLYFEEVRQVAALVGRQTTTVFGRVYQNVAPGAKSAMYDFLVTTLQVSAVADEPLDALRYVSVL